MYKHLLPLSIAALAACPLYPAAAQGPGIPATPVPSAPVSPGPAAPALTLQRAWQLADAASIALRQTEAKRAALAGDAADARGVLWNNPRLFGERARREVPRTGLQSEKQREWTVAVEQTFEIAGQQGYRRQAAQQELSALDATVDETRREVRAEVEERFVQVLALQERIATESAALKLIEDTAKSIGKRVAAGEDSRLDGNLANVEAVRAHNQIGALGEQLIEARAELASTLQLPPAELPEVAGSLRRTGYLPTLAELQASAERRPLLTALSSREQAAKSRLSLERAARYPDVTLAVSTAREGPTGVRERLTGVSLSVPLPLFRRNAGGIGRASSDLTQVQIERETSARGAHAGVTALWQKLNSLVGRVTLLESAVLPALEENQRLSVKSLEAGEISLVQLLLVNRQLLDGRRDLIEAQTELRLTRIALEQAAGWLAPAAER